MSAIAANWFYMNGADRVGPVTQVELCDMFRRGVLGLQTLVWSDAFKDWTPASSIAALRALIPQEVVITPLPGQLTPLNYETPVVQGPVGISGWLILPAIGLVLTPIGLVLSVIALFALTTKFQSAAPAGSVGALKTIAWLDAIFCAYVVVTALMFFAKKRIAPALMMGMYVGSIVLAFIGIALMKPVATPNASAPPGMEWMGLIKPVLVALVWIPYFRISKRVKNTFVN